MYIKYCENNVSRYFIYSINRELEPETKQNQLLIVR